MDQRKEFLQTQLNKLSNTQLERIINYDGVVTDSVNYEPKTDRWCPMGAALNIKCKPESQNEAIELITLYGALYINSKFEFKSIKGISGNFYTTNRESDLKQLCQEIIADRRSAEGEESICVV